MCGFQDDRIPLGDDLGDGWEGAVLVEEEGEDARVDKFSIRAEEDGWGKGLWGQRLSWCGRRAACVVSGECIGVWICGYGGGRMGGSTGAGSGNGVDGVMAR